MQGRPAHFTEDLRRGRPMCRPEKLPTMIALPTGAHAGAPLRKGWKFHAAHPRRVPALPWGRGAALGGGEGDSKIFRFYINRF